MNRRILSTFFIKTSFVFFAVVLLAELLAILHNSSVSLLSIVLISGFFSLTLVSSFWGLFVFTATIPFFNGYFVTQGGGDPFLVFTGVYFAWFLKQLLNKRNHRATGLSGFFAYLLIVVLFLNLGLVFSRSIEWAAVSKAWFEWLSHTPFFGQGHRMWQVSAALVFLKGLFLFSMISMELDDTKKWSLFTKTIYFQAGFVAYFSFSQLFNFKTHGVNYLGLTLPFDDIHSYGSVVVLLFAIFACLLKNNIKIRKVYQVSSLNLFVNGAFATLFFILCLYSSSRITWVSAGGVILLLSFSLVKKKTIFAILLPLIVVVVLSGNYLVPRLLQSGNQSLYRMGTMLNVKNIANDKALQVRFELWGRSLRMIREYPFTGIGIGNVYRNSQLYKSRSVGQWDVENSHNYFLQVGAELGLSGLILLLLLLFTLFWSPPGVIFDNSMFLFSNRSATPYAFGVGAYLVTMLTGHALLLSGQQFMFWSIAAVLSSGKLVGYSGGTAVLPVALKNMQKTGAVVFLVFLAGFLFNVYGKAPWTISGGYGFYSEENWEGTSMRWMSEKAEFYLPAGRERLRLKVFAHPINSQAPDGLNFNIYFNDIIAGSLHFVDGGTKIISYNLSRFNRDKIKVNLEVDKVFCPVKIGLSSDYRTLGVAVGELDFPRPVLTPMLLLE